MATADEIRAAKMGQFSLERPDRRPRPAALPARRRRSATRSTRSSPRGFVTTLAGAADVGKSLTAMALADRRRPATRLTWPAWASTAAGANCPTPRTAPC